MNKLPLYKAVLKYDDDGMYIISLVSDPAVETNFVAFDKDKEPVSFSIDEEKRMIKGVVARADYPIYRNNGGYEYMVTFDAEVIRQMAERYMANGYNNNVDEQHNHHLVEGVHMQEMFIKDTENGIDPKGFDDVADGSLFAVYKVDNDLVWNDIKEGKVKGFSLYGYLDYQKVEDEYSSDEDVEEILNIINQIKLKLK